MRKGTSIALKKCATTVLLSTWLCGVSVAGLTQRIHKIAPPQTQDEYSVHIVQPGSGAVLYSYNPRKPLIPASNMKLVTTAAAVRYLGPNF